MKSIFYFVLLAGAACALVSCGSGSAAKFAAQPMPNIGGAWEFIALPSVSSGNSTGIEVALKEGTSFQSGYYQYNGQLSASGAQIAFVGVNQSGVAFGGNCPGFGPDTSGNNLAGSISGVGGTFNFTYTENGYDFTVTGTLSADGKSMTGTYASASGSGCPDSGTINGLQVSKLAGTYTGKLCEPLDSACAAGAKDVATVTLSQSGTTLTVNMVLTGVDNTSFSLTGPVAANYFSAQGTFNGQTVVYDGYYLATVSSTGATTQTLYLANATSDASQPAHAGTLTVPAP
jgi:hypothetical protein